MVKKIRGDFAIWRNIQMKKYRPSPKQNTPLASAFSGRNFFMCGRKIIILGDFIITDRMSRIHSTITDRMSRRNSDGCEFIFTLIHLWLYKYLVFPFPYFAKFGFTAKCRSAK